MTRGTPLNAMPKPTHKWIGHQGLSIAGDSWGDSKNRLVVLLHGQGQTRHAWKAAGQKLGAAGYYAVSYDARGHGDSDWADNGLYTQEAKIEDLIAILSALDQPSPVLVGASMGGVTSLIAVGEQRIAAAALVLVDTAPQIELDGVSRIRAFMSQNPGGFDSLEEVAAAIASYQPQRVKPQKLDGLAKNVRLGDDGKFRWHWDPKTRAQEIDLHQRQQRLEECARAVNIPTLLIRGGLSDIVSEAGAQSFLKLCPRCEYVNVADAAHMVTGDRNDIFSAAVVDFLLRTVPQIKD